LEMGVDGCGAGVGWTTLCPELCVEVGKLFASLWGRYVIGEWG
jgi:hypothetical protein